MFIFLVETCLAFLSTENTHRRNRGAKLEVTAMEGLLSPAGCHGAMWARKGSSGRKAKLGIFGVDCIAFTGAVNSSAYCSIPFSIQRHSKRYLAGQ